MRPKFALKEKGLLFKEEHVFISAGKKLKSDVYSEPTLSLILFLGKPRHPLPSPGAQNPDTRPAAPLERGPPLGQLQHHVTQVTLLHLRNVIVTTFSKFLCYIFNTETSSQNTINTTSDFQRPSNKHAT